jgi:phage-related tail protein
MVESKRRSSGGRAGARRSAADDAADVMTRTGSTGGSAAFDDPDLDQDEEEVDEQAMRGSNEEGGNGRGGGFIGRVRERAGAQLTMQKDRAIDSVGAITQAVRRTTQELRDAQYGGVAEYIERGAEQLDRLTTRLRNKDVGEMARDLQNAARRRPGAFVGSAFLAGLLAARFLKSSSPSPRISGTERSRRR